MFIPPMDVVVERHAFGGLLPDRIFPLTGEAEQDIVGEGAVWSAVEGILTERLEGATYKFLPEIQYLIVRYSENNG